MQSLGCILRSPGYEGEGMELSSSFPECLKYPESQAGEDGTVIFSLLPLSEKLLGCGKCPITKQRKRTLLWHFWSRKMLASCPWLRISRRVCWDWPVTWAKVSPSAIVAMKLPWTMFTISIILAALPTSPGSETYHWAFLQKRYSSLVPPSHTVLTLLDSSYQALGSSPFPWKTSENLPIFQALKGREKS